MAFDPAPTGELAGGTRHGRSAGESPCRPRARHTAAPGAGSRPRRDLVRQGPGADPRGDSRDGGTTAGSGARRHGGACRTHRLRLRRWTGTPRPANQPRDTGAGRCMCIGTTTAWWLSEDGSSRRSASSSSRPERGTGGAVSTHSEDVRRRRLRRRFRGNAVLEQQQAERSRCWPRRRCTMGSIPERRATATSGGPRRRAGARRCRGPRPVGARERRTRFRGNVSAPGFATPAACDAARSRRSRRGGLCPDPHDPPGVTSRAPSPRPRLSIPWLRSCASARAITSTTGARRPTTLSNLAMLCRRHHRAVHEGATRSIGSPMATSVPPSGRPAAA